VLRQQRGFDLHLIARIGRQLGEEEACGFCAAAEGIEFSGDSGDEFGDHDFWPRGGKVLYRAVRATED
jgi:hypothetical protein